MEQGAEYPNATLYGREPTGEERVLWESCERLRKENALLRTYIEGLRRIAENTDACWAIDNLRAALRNTTNATKEQQK